MKLKLYFLATSNEVVAGPFFTVDQAINAKNDFIPVYRELLRVVKIDGQFDLVEI